MPELRYPALGQLQGWSQQEGGMSKPQPRFYGRPLHVGIPNVKHQGHTDPSEVFSCEREREEQRSQIAEDQRVIYNQRPGIFQTWREFRRVLLKALAAFGVCGFVVGLFWSTIAPLIHKLLVRMGW